MKKFCLITAYKWIRSQKANIKNSVYIIMLIHCDLIFYYFVLPVGNYLNSYIYILPDDILKSY